MKTKKPLLAEKKSLWIYQG